MNIAEFLLFQYCIIFNWSGEDEQEDYYLEKSTQIQILQYDKYYSALPRQCLHLYVELRIFKNWINEYLPVNYASYLIENPFDKCSGRTMGFSKSDLFLVVCQSFLVTSIIGIGYAAVLPELSQTTTQTSVSVCQTK